MERWATFDCYGTLIDWNTGIRDELARVFDLEPPPEPEPEPEPEVAPEPEPEPETKRGLFGRKKKKQAKPEAEPEPEEPEEDEGHGGEEVSEEELERRAKLDELLARYHELEPEVQKEGGFMSYRNVMTEVMRRLGAPAGTEEGLANSLPSWQPFEEVPAALTELRERGWKLAILSNSDPDLIAASKELLGVPFDITIVASEIMSYKPALRHWQEFQYVASATRENHVHVAASAFHDIAPAAKLRIPNVWINRLGEHAPLTPTRELPDLTDLPDTLDQLVTG